jgi:ribosomal protein L29
MGTTELAQRTPRPVSPAEAVRLSKSKLLPEHIADDPASVEYMMRIGESLGIDPVASFQHIFVFPDKNGRLKAGMSAHLMVALAQAAGHVVHVEGNALKATARLIRNTSLEDIHRFNAMAEIERQQKRNLLANTESVYRSQRDLIRDQIDDLKALAELGGEGLQEEIKNLQRQLLELRKQYNFQELRDKITETEFDLAKMVHFKSEWTKARADQAGLTGKSVWQSFGPEMLKARAKASVVRDGAIDVILGIKRILSDMGLEFTDEVDDELAVAGVIYPPEELGAEVDEDGVPIKGRVVNVTAPGVSKEQDRLVAAGRKLIDGKSADEISKAIEQSLRNPKVDKDTKISRLDAVLKAVNEAGRGKEEVSQDDGSCELSAYLERMIQELNSPVQP